MRPPTLSKNIFHKPETDKEFAPCTKTLSKEWCNEHHIWFAREACGYMLNRGLCKQSLYGHAHQRVKNSQKADNEKAEYQNTESL